MDKERYYPVMLKKLRRSKEIKKLKINWRLYI